MIIGRCNQHTRRNHAYEYPHRAVIRPSCWVLSIILERAMHRIRMRTRTTGCMQLHKPSYKAGMVWYPRLRVGFDAEFKWFGTAWIFFFSRPKSASVCYSYQTGKKLFRCTACVRSFFFFFFYFERQVWRPEFRLSSYKMQESGTKYERSTKYMSNLRFIFLRFAVPEKIFRNEKVLWDTCTLYPRCIYVYGRRMRQILFNYKKG